MLAQLQVERRQRLVEQQDVRLHRQRPGNRHALLLAAGQFVHHLVALPRQRNELEQFIGLLAPFGPADTAHLQREGNVVGHRHQGEEGEILEDKRRRALVRTDAAHVLAADQDAPERRLGEP